MRIKRAVPAEKARIELIPMIDTMAFLLVFFMIASLAMTQQLGIPVNLPRARSASQQPSSDRTLVVSVDSKGHIFLNKQALRWGELENTVRARVQARPELIVVLSGDQGLRYGALMRVFDALRRTGAQQILLATDERQMERVPASK